MFASTPKCCHKKVTAYTDDDEENIHQQQLHKNSVSILPPTIIKFIHNFYPCTSPANVYAPPENRSLQIIQYIDFFLEYLQIYIGKNNGGTDNWTSISIIILSLFRKYLKCFQISMWPMCRHSLLHSLVQVPSDQQHTKVRGSHRENKMEKSIAIWNTILWLNFIFPKLQKCINLVQIKILIVIFLLCHIILMLWTEI